MLKKLQGDVSCIIARITGGKRATYMDALDELDANGVRVRLYLTRFLARRGVNGQLFTKVTGPIYLTASHRTPLQ